jgi:hypothetical protein
MTSPFCIKAKICTKLEFPEILAFWVTCGESRRILTNLLRKLRLLVVVFQMTTVIQLGHVTFAF